MKEKKKEQKWTRRLFVSKCGQPYSDFPRKNEKKKDIT
jgi:hypothetical protein